MVTPNEINRENTAYGTATRDPNRARTGGLPHPAPGGPASDEHEHQRDGGAGEQGHGHPEQRSLDVGGGHRQVGAHVVEPEEVQAAGPQHVDEGQPQAAQRVLEDGDKESERRRGHEREPPTTGRSSGRGGWSVPGRSRRRRDRPGRRERLGGRPLGGLASAASTSSATSVGVRPTFTPTAANASALAWAVPVEPVMMAPAWPIRLPGGAVNGHVAHHGLGDRRADERGRPLLVVAADLADDHRQVGVLVRTEGGEGLDEPDAVDRVAPMPMHVDCPIPAGSART